MKHLQRVSLLALIITHTLFTADTTISATKTPIFSNMQGNASVEFASQDIPTQVHHSLKELLTLIENQEIQPTPELVALLNEGFTLVASYYHDTQNKALALETALRTLNPSHSLLSSSGTPPPIKQSTSASTTTSHFNLMPTKDILHQKIHR